MDPFLIIRRGMILIRLLDEHYPLGAPSTSRRYAQGVWHITARAEPFGRLRTGSTARAAESKPAGMDRHRMESV
jgi:hypothetical protein